MNSILLPVTCSKRKEKIYNIDIENNIVPGSFQSYMLHSLHLFPHMIMKVLFRWTLSESGLKNEEE